MLATERTGVVGACGLASLVGAAALLGSVTLVSAQAPQAATPMGGLRLEDLERIALEKNPTLSQVQASIRAAQGRQTQAGLYPNPLVGYQLEDQNTRTPNQNKNFFWFQVPIVTAGKLQKSRDLAATDSQRAAITADMQRLRVLTTVRMLYYEGLGAARIVDERQALAKLTREAVGVSGELFNVGQADRPDVLDVEMQAQRAEIELMKAQSHQQRVWRMLASAVGEPSLPIAKLEGDLTAKMPRFDGEAVLARVLRESPEVRQAQVNVERAKAALERVRAERIPNLFVRTKLGYNSEQVTPGKDVGFETGIEIGIPLPLFDRQQGNVATAQADLEHAQAEVRRLELALRSELATVIRGYEDARMEVERYERQILPRAQQSVELYRKGFQQMAAAYPQVLIAQRTLFQSRAEYTQALVDLWRTASLLEGMLLSGGLDAPFHMSVSQPPPTGHVPTAAGRPAD
ncbi:MAG TPA: TolC family protein [Methylomirabilota bacterium]|nr:TolC family protein [Methylomirabilota bacterium]